MKFDALQAENEYVTTQTSYRALAEKYEVSFETVKNYGKKNHWVEKRKEHNSIIAQTYLENDCKNKVDKLENLRTATDNLIEGVMNSSKVIKKGCDSQTANQLASAINKLIAAQRDLCGLLSEKDKLQYGKEQTEQNESGVVFMPAIVPDADVVVSEGEG